jgi:hypothetical protein
MTNLIVCLVIRQRCETQFHAEDQQLLRIVIWMYFDEPQHEGRPYFHATYGDDEASFDIDGIELIAGGLPRRAQKMVTEWAKKHQEELRQNWNLAREHKPPRPIDPLG